MHCVACGISLHNNNQAGLVCQICKQEREGNKRSRGQAVAVRYCFACGRVYHPEDTSVRHLSCVAAKGRAGIPDLSGSRFCSTLVIVV